MFGFVACSRRNVNPPTSVNTNDSTVSAPAGAGATSSGIVTTNQQSAIQRIYREDGQNLLGLRQQLMSKQFELNALMMSQTPDETRTRALIKDLTDFEAQALQAEATMQQKFSQAGCSTCNALGVGGGPRATGGQPAPGIVGAKPLSPEQQTKVQQIYRDEGQRALGLRQQLVTKQSELNALVTSKTPDETRIRTLTKEISSLNGQLLESEANLRLNLSRAGVPFSGQGMWCPMCGSMNGGVGGGPSMMGQPGMGMGPGMMGGRGMMGGGQWGYCW